MQKLKALYLLNKSSIDIKFFVAFFINRSNSFRTMKPKTLDCMYTLHFLRQNITLVKQCERKPFLNFKEVKLYIIQDTLYSYSYNEECCNASGPSVSRPFMLAISYQYKVVKLCILKSITSLGPPRVIVCEFLKGGQYTTCAHNIRNA